MNVNRRDLLLGGPAAFFGFNFAGILEAQAQSPAPVDHDVVNFWVHGMGVPANNVVGGEITRGRQPSGPSVSDFGREPLFLHHDVDSDSLITADQIPANKLISATATDVTFQLVRMRLNNDDDAKFRSYTSGGIYVDLQQTAQTSNSLMQDLVGGATSLFSAIAPPPSGGKSSGGKSGSSGKKGKGNQFLPYQAATAAAGGAAIPLQQAKQAQSISLPGGVGKHSFACFAKDKRKTLFGQFVNVFAQLASSPMLSYLPMLSLPAVGVQTVNAVRSLVGNLQAHGQNQQWIMISPPLDVATTPEGLQSAPDALRLRAGNYVLVPKEQSNALKAAQMDKLKVLDGFLVPKEAKTLDVYDAYPGTAPGVSYITLSVGVQASKKAATAGKGG